MERYAPTARPIFYSFILIYFTVEFLTFSFLAYGKKNCRERNSRKDLENDLEENVQYIAKGKISNMPMTESIQR